jgi:YesN/AraC family two-component response regulator
LVFLGISRLCVEGYNKNSLVKNGDYAITETGEYYESLRQLFELLIAENVQKPDYFTQISDSVLSIVISLILRLTTAEQEKKEINKTYDEVKNYIDDNFASIDTIDDVCQNLYVNKYYLTHLFKDTIGVPPLRYLIQKRIDYAKTLLKSTNKPISVIAKECGYMDSAYFCRVFKKVTSISPKAYRDINFDKE